MADETNGTNGEAETKPAEMTPEEKLAARAKRWGLPHTGPPADSGDDAEKLAARAKRWGLPEPAAEDDAEKLAARAKRWGVVTPEPEKPQPRRSGRGDSNRPPEVQEAKQDLEAFLARKAAKNGRTGPPLYSDAIAARRPSKGVGKSSWSAPERGTKRDREEPPDAEEDERRKQRAARFGLK